MSGTLKSIATLKGKIKAAEQGAVRARVALTNVAPYPRQRRTEFDATALGELADSMRTHGMLQPPLVRSTGSGRYELILGERRVRAAAMLGWTNIDVLVKDVDDKEAYAIHLAENIHRENLGTLELVKAIEDDVKRAKGSVTAVAEQYQKSKAWVSKHLSLANGGAAMQEAIEQGITADKEVLSAIARIEKSDKASALDLVRKLKVAGTGAGARTIAAKHAKLAKAEKKVAKKPGKVETLAELALRSWKTTQPIPRNSERWPLIGIEVAGASRFYKEFLQLSKKHGDAVIVPDVKHKNPRYVWVKYGNNQTLRDYPADDLRLTYVDESKD
ncbi:MAG: ParB/RepB/Spo0J family partition protein [Casimicrobium sp.]